MNGPEAVLASWPLGPVLGRHSAGSTQLGGYEIVNIPHPGLDFGYLPTLHPFTV